MATVTRTYLVDDLDESEEDVENVLLALDGTNYEIDLSAANAGRLREKLARVIAAASAVRSRRLHRPSVAPGVRQHLTVQP